LFVACSAGYAQQKKVYLEKSSSTDAVYATDEKKDNYLTYSLQIRYIMKNDNILGIGYHSRRGLIAGMSLKL